MKTNKVEKRQVTSDRKARSAWTGKSGHGSPVTCLVSAFTLVELLVVIAIIAVIAALLLPLARTVKQKAYIQTAQSEMAQLETAIGQYKATYGFYPPGNPNNSVSNQLYFELVGTTNTAAPGGMPVYRTLDGSATIDTNHIHQWFGVTGFMNCSKPGAGGSAPQAQNFLPGLKPTQVATVQTDKDNTVNVLVTSDGGPDTRYNPMGPDNADANPWRYNSDNPTNNPGSYDLYVQLSIGGTTHLICNWTKQVQISNPLP